MTYYISIKVGVNSGWMYYTMCYSLDEAEICTRDLRLKWHDAKYSTRI